MIILVIGLPGSGKTYFADHLTERLNAVHINSDRVRKKMDKMGNYDFDDKMQVYNEMIRLMKEGMDGGKNVIVDATFYRQSIRDKFAEAANSRKQPILFIEIKANDKTIRERTSKKRKESEADYEVYQKLKSTFQPLTEKHLTLYSDEVSINEMLDKAIDYIKVQQ